LFFLETQSTSSSHWVSKIGLVANEVIKVAGLEAHVIHELLPSLDGVFEICGFACESTPMPRIGL